MIQRGKLNFVMGISFGSEGKGNISDYFGRRGEFDMAISNNSPNAGHQFKLDDGSVETVKMLPVSGIVNKESTIWLGSGSVINIDRVIEEIKKYDLEDRVYISPYAPIVTEYCKEYEREHLKYIASTFQGSGAALGLKAMRSKNIGIVRDCVELNRWCRGSISDTIINRLKLGQTGLVEICQGYGLTVDSDHFPYTTSRPVNVGQALGYLDVPASTVGDVIGIARSYIIRVGNVEGGTSGNTFDDSKELTWEEMSQRVGREVKEMTTVTGRVRRVFTFSKKLFEMAVHRNGVNVLFLSFVDYLNEREQAEMKGYLMKFNFKEIYFVHGFGDFDKNIERVK